MKFYSPNSWQKFITQKHIKAIYEKICQKQYAKTFVLLDLFFLVIGIVIDRLFDGHISNNFWSIYFMILLTILLIIGIINFIIFLIEQIKKFIEWKNFSLSSETPEDMIKIFNDIICYDIITSKTYMDLLKCKNINSNEKIFYYIERSYYRNKAINQLFSMVQKISEVFSDNMDKILYYNKISVVRLENLLNIIDDITNSLSYYFDELDVSNSLLLISDENKKYYEQFSKFKNMYKEAFYSRYY